MIVRELIKLLEDCPPEAPVRVQIDDARNGQVWHGDTVLAVESEQYGGGITIEAET